MLKIVTATVAATAALAFTGTASADVSRGCRDASAGFNSCAVTASERKVELISIRLGFWTRGSYALTCVKGSHSLHREGRLRRNANRILPLGNLVKPTCQVTLNGRARNGHPARARIVLIGG